MTKYLTAGLATALAMLPMAALAHDAPGAHIDAVHGFLHPLTGLDHVLAMVAVGIFAAQLGGRSLWAVPAAFVLAMIAGGVIGHYGVQLPMVEQGIALSVILMGLLVAAGVKLPVGPAMALVAVFAVFHGNAHGAEGIGAASFAGYAAGFVLATALLHAAGAVLGSLLERPGGTLSRNARRVVGGAGAVAGAAILLG